VAGEDVGFDLGGEVAAVCGVDVGCCCHCFGVSWVFSWKSMMVVMMVVVCETCSSLRRRDRGNAWGAVGIYSAGCF
jgi:hypothetical protein